MYQSQNFRPLIDNPYVNRIYLDREFTKAGEAHDVLVVETNIRLASAKPGSPDGEHLDELLLDLDQLQVLAAKEIGPFDRIDIRSY